MKPRPPLIQIMTLMRAAVYFILTMGTLIGCLVITALMIIVAVRVIESVLYR